LNPALCQTTFATITGRITDSSGSSVSGARVVGTHLESNYRYSAVSNPAGDYTISQLREGDYTLKISAVGFKEFVVQKISLVSLDVRRIDATLEVGSLETRVEVQAVATLIETETVHVI
jgi:hypothetical protein